MTSTARWDSDWGGTRWEVERKEKKVEEGSRHWGGKSLCARKAVRSKAITDEEQVDHPINNICYIHDFIVEECETVRDGQAVIADEEDDKSVPANPLARERVDVATTAGG